MYYPETDIDEVQNAEEVYGDVLDALVESCKRNDVRITLNQIHSIMEQVSDVVVQQTRAERDRLNDAWVDYPSRTGIQQQKLEEAAYRELVEHFRSKVRPVITNPATPGFGGAA